MHFLMQLIAVINILLPTDLRTISPKNSANLSVIFCVMLAIINQLLYIDGYMVYSIVYSPCVS